MLPEKCLGWHQSKDQKQTQATHNPFRRSFAVRFERAIFFVQHTVRNIVDFALAGAISPFYGILKASFYRSQLVINPLLLSCLVLQLRFRLIQKASFVQSFTCSTCNVLEPTWSKQDTTKPSGNNNNNIPRVSHFQQRG